MMPSLTGKHVMITGAARGIGAACARRLAADGAVVAIADMADEAGAALAAEMGPEHRYVHLDVTSPDAWDEALTSLQRAWGGLDLLMLNAGVMTRPPGAPMKDDVFPWLTQTGLRRNISVNIEGVVNGTLAVLPLMRGREGATILITASVAGIANNPHDPFYTMSKYAVVGFTRAMAPNLESKGIRIAAICPMGVNTDMTPQDLRAEKARAGAWVAEPEDLAEGALHIWKHAGNGEAWVAGVPEIAFRYDFAKPEPAQPAVAHPA